MLELTVGELEAAGAIDLGCGPWHRVEQRQIDLFAEATGDDSWLHVDPARASQGPFGTTVAHGYAQVAMLPRLLSEILAISDMKGRVNYGIDQLRFIAPMRTGSEVRLCARVVESNRRASGLLYKTAVKIEAKGSDRPTMVGEILLLVF